MKNAKEFKVRYNHKKALRIIKQINARLSRKETLKDLYLVDDPKDIYKISVVNREMRLVHLTAGSSGFDMVLSEKLGPKTKKTFSPLFGKGRGVMIKERSIYRWKSSEIALDRIVGIGEFLEIYPASEKDKKILFEFLGVKPASLITRSYSSMRKS